MSPEAEAHKIIAISFGKIANSRVQRGGPKLCKNLLVANLIHKARTFYDEQVYCFQPKYVQSEASATFENSESAQPLHEENAEKTEVLCEDDDMQSGVHKDCQAEDSKRSVQNVNECDDKENDSPVVSSDVSEIVRVQTGSRTRTDVSTMSKSRAIPSRCLKRRNCSEGKADYETHRSPSKRFCERRSRRRSSSADSLDLAPLGQESYDSDSGLASTEVMDVEQISSLVSAFSNSLKDFSYVSCGARDVESANSPDKTVQSPLWRSNSVPDMVLCSQQVTSVLKMRQQRFETSTPVVA